MKTPFHTVLPAYSDRFGKPSPDVFRLLTGQQKAFGDTDAREDDVKDAALFLLAHAARMGFPVAVFAKLKGMSRLEWRLEELGAPAGRVNYIYRNLPYAVAELALVYRVPIHPLKITWPITIR